MKPGQISFFSRIAFSFVLIASGGWGYADEPVSQSAISSVKLYRNQAEITRTTRLSLKKGENTVVLGGLPRSLYDWSVKGSLPKNYSGRILSVEVEQKALLNKRQQRVIEIEKKLEALRDRDLELLDALKNIQSQQSFLDSVVSFTNLAASKELQTRIPQIKVWDDTLRYTTEKRASLLARKRDTEKQREELGKQIQQWEFELSQIAGSGYYRNYQALNKLTLSNRAAMEVQQFAGFTDQYGEKKKMLKEPGSGRVDIEKRVIVHIFSSSPAEVDFRISYLIPETSWQMLYDVRASRESRDLTMVVFANIYQKTAEDWNNISLSLSTGSPVNAIQPPVLTPWYLDVARLYRPETEGDYEKKAGKSAAPYKKAMKDEFAQAEEAIPTAGVSEKGPYMEISLPLKQTIFSSTKYQKKYIQEFTMKDSDKVSFYYRLIPEQVRSGFLNVKITNTSALPWLSGEAQIFLENEFMGKAAIPFTPKGKEEDLVLGIETRLSSRKELVKKYEDTSGLFGGKRRIVYSYKITVESDLPRETGVEVLEHFPVSRNEKITTEVLNLSSPFIKDDKFEKSTEFAQGIRKWRFDIGPNQKKEITYDVVISFDKDISVQGIR